MAYDPFVALAFLAGHTKRVQPEFTAMVMIQKPRPLCIRLMPSGHRLSVNPSRSASIEKSGPGVLGLQQWQAIEIPEVVKLCIRLGRETELKPDRSNLSLVEKMIR